MKYKISIILAALIVFVALLDLILTFFGADAPSFKEIVLERIVCILLATNLLLLEIKIYRKRGK